LKQARRFALVLVVLFVVTLIVSVVHDRSGSATPAGSASTDPYADKRATLAEASPDYVVAHDVAVQDEITPTERAAALSIALKDARVMALLGDDRYAVSSVALDERGAYGEKNAGCLGARSCAIVTLVDYSAATTLVVNIDLLGSSATAITTQDGTVTVVGTDEAAEAYRVAKDDPSIQAALDGREAVASGYPEPIQQAAGPCSEEGKHRCVMLVFEVTPDYLRAFVDLTDGRVDSWTWEPG
jgi:hypothetical protein